MRILTELPQQRTPWQARLLALALGVLGPIVLARSVRTPVVVSRADARDTTERVVAVDLPTLAQVVEDERVPPLAGPGVVPPTSPARDRATPAAATMPIFPAFPSRDSSGSADPASGERVPRARELFGSPASGRALCLPPACGTSGTSVAAGGSGGAGAGIVFPPMSREERDSIARAVITAAAAAGGSESHPASTFPPGTAGVSLPVGLPGGGPTRAQRERARVLDADVSLRLARIRARADSIAAARRRDSVARVMPRTDDKAVAPDA